MNAVYKHIASQKLYRVIGTGRSVANPQEKMVMYKQLYDSKLRDTGEKLPYGSLWIREENDFNKKFQLYLGNQKS